MKGYRVGDPDAPAGDRSNWERIERSAPSGRRPATTDWSRSNWERIERVNGTATRSRTKPFSASSNWERIESHFPFTRSVTAAPSSNWERIERRGAANLPHPQLIRQAATGKELKDGRARSSTYIALSRCPAATGKELKGANAPPPRASRIARPSGSAFRPGFAPSLSCLTARRGRGASPREPPSSHSR